MNLKILLVAFLGGFLGGIVAEVALHSRPARADVSQAAWKIQYSVEQSQHSLAHIERIEAEQLKVICGSSRSDCKMEVP